MVYKRLKIIVKPAKNGGLVDYWDKQAIKEVLLFILDQMQECKDSEILKTKKTLIISHAKIPAYEVTISFK
jgi:hypothetical protein